MRKIALGIFMCCFLLLIPYLLRDTGLFYVDDDYDYFAHSSSIAFGQFPSYKKEYFTIMKEGPQSSVGPGLMASPFVFLFSCLDRLAGSSIIDQRTAANIPTSWSQFGFVFGSNFYFSLGCLLLYCGIRRICEERFAVLSVVLMILCQGLPLFAFRRPMFSHIYEFFLQSLFIFLFLKHERGEKQFIKKSWHYILLGTAGCLIYLVRYNNIIFALLWPFMFLFNGFLSLRTKDFWKKLFLTYFPFIPMIFVFQIWPSMINHYTPYTWVTEFLLQNMSFQLFLSRLFYIFTGLDWGLIYTAPFVVLGFASLCSFSFPLKKKWILISLPLLINFLLIVFWGSQAGWYGYRLFIASAMPILALPLAVFLKELETKAKKTLGLLWVIIAGVPFLSMLLFEKDPTALNLAQIKTYTGNTDFTNNIFQFHVWQTVLFHPLETLANIYDKSGFLYLNHLFLTLGKFLGIWPNAFVTEYPVFRADIFIRLTMLYMLPFILCSLIRKINK